MNEQSNPLTPEELDEILGPQDQVLAPLVEEYERVKADRKAAERKEGELKKQIIGLMDEQGAMSVTVSGRRLTFSTRTFYGLDVTTPDKMRRMKEWMERYAPSLNIPATDKVKKAVEEWEADNPGQDIPDFIKVEERRSLSNTKAR